MQAIITTIDAIITIIIKVNYKQATSLKQARRLQVDRANCRYYSRGEVVINKQATKYTIVLVSKQVFVVLLLLLDFNLKLRLFLQIRLR